jgi:predicted 3-demethylubiquinone-9 3-methyltransferase (glyoxalase superfamily)
MKSLCPCLWFDGHAEDAAKFYTSLFKQSALGKISHFPKAGEDVSGQKAGSVMTVEFKIENLTVLALNGGPLFKFTPAMSFFVWCESEAEVDRLWSKLSDGGEARMALGAYPWSEKYGWVMDKFGVNWQLNLASHRQKIAPALLFVDKLFGRGEAALKLYASLFPNAEIGVITRDEKAKSVAYSVLSIGGQDLVLMEGAGEHGFTFNEAFSLMVYCKDQNEIDHYWNSLISGGGSPAPCGWLKDEFAVSWQIVPDFMRDAICGPGDTENMMNEMYKMQKLDYRRLNEAYHKKA